MFEADVPTSGSGGEYGPEMQTTPLPSTSEKLADFAALLYRRRWPAMAAFLLAVSLSSVRAYTLPTWYEAGAWLLIDAKPEVVAFQQILDGNDPQPDYRQTQYDLLRSRTLVALTLDAVDLWEHPELAAAAVGETVEASQPTMAALLPFDLLPATPAVSNPASRRSATIDAFLGRLTIAPFPNSRIVQVRFRAQDRELPARVVNGLLDTFIEQHLDFEHTTSRAASDWLTEQISIERARLEQSESAMQRYREENDALSLDERQDIVATRLSDLNDAVTVARTEAIEKEALYRQIVDTGSDPAALGSLPAFLSNGYIQRLKTELATYRSRHAELSVRRGERHPEMVKLSSVVAEVEVQLDEEIRRLVVATEQDYRAAQRKSEALTEEFESQKREVLQMDRKAIAYDLLEREAKSKRVIYESLLQRAREMGVSGQLRTTNARIVDRAEPPRAPVWPNRLRQLTFGSVFGLALAVGLAMSLERLDDRIKRPDDIAAYLRVPTLGMLPLIRPEEVPPGVTTAEPTSGRLLIEPVEAKPGRLLIEDGKPENLLEAFRSLRTNASFSIPDNAPRTVAITSTRPGEGKTTVASNLALTIAQSGRRVLLVDADLRRPTLHTVFGVAETPGLSNVIVGDVTPDAAIVKPLSADLWLLPAGAIPPNPPALLFSETFGELVERFRADYDWVIFDTPPVQAVTDAAILAHHVSSVMLIVGADVTARGAARNALDQLRASGAGVMGAVLNRVDLKRHGYYYRRYARREDESYYQGAA